MHLSAQTLLLQQVAVLMSAADAVRSLVPFQSWNNIREVVLHILWF